MRIFKYYQKVKINLVLIILGISLSITLTKCKVDANFEVKDFTFCRAVLINNKVPLVKISWNTLEAWEKWIPATEYQVRITSSNGDDELAKDGIFKTTLCKPDVTYTIHWKLNSEQSWHIMSKTMPTELPRLKQSSIERNKDAIYIDKVDNVNKDAFFYSEDYFPANGDPTDASHGRIQGFSYILKSIWEMSENDGRLQLWPPSYYNPDYIYANNNEPCLNPFSWGNFFRINYPIVLNQVCHSDYQLLKQLEKNYSNRENPLFVGNSCGFDYFNGSMIGHMFTYNRYHDVDVEKTIPQENFVTYEVKYYGGNVDTSKIKIVWPFIGLPNTATYDYLQLNKKVCKSDTLFFEDYFKDCYRILAGLPCGFKQSEYNYKIKLVYQDVATGQYFNFTSQELKYDCKPGHIVLDIQ
ncbi:hypothetical protein LBMAG26_17240 [Bacteroidota bacterium]|nr:hypothetical protein LBMAG26_17240 [Bacteroidota bacterium]